MKLLAPVAFLLLIAGGVMFGVCKDPGDCNNNQTIAEAGKIMMIVGGSLYGLALVIVCCCSACIYDDVSKHSIPMMSRV